MDKELVQLNNRSSKVTGRSPTSVDRGKFNRGKRWGNRVGSVFLTTLMVFPLLFPTSNEVEASGTDIPFSVGESTSSYRTTNVTVPDKAVVTGLTTNTGSVSYTRTSPTNVQVTMSGGSYIRSEYDPYMYSKSISKTDYSSVDSFPSSQSYSDGSGYSGTYYASGPSWLYSGELVYTSSFTATDSRTTSAGGSSSSLPSSLTYNSGGYYGTLYGGSAYVVSGSPYSTWPVTRTVTQDHPDSWFSSQLYVESGTYSGNIPKSGSYSTTGHAGGATANTYLSNTYSSVSSINSSHPFLERTNYTPDGGDYVHNGTTYRGSTLSGTWVAGYFSKCGTHWPVPQGYRQRYCGTATKKETRKYTQTYSGDLVKPDTQVWRKDYSGTVTRPGYDNRVYAQSYSGTAYASGTRYYYAYEGTLTYVLDNSLPTIGSVTLTPSGWTNGNVTITLSGISDVGAAGYKRTKLPNGTYSSGTNVSYVATNNGTYRFEVEDDVGNVLVQDVVVDKIERIAPTASISHSPTNWVNDKVTLKVDAIEDTGGSGYHRTLLPSGSYVSDTEVLYDVTSNGTYHFDVFDVAGNSVRKSITVTNIDKGLPNGVVTQSPTVFTKGPVTLTIGSLTDVGGSGVRDVKLPDGSIVTGTSASYVVSENGTYNFEVRDVAGNVRVVSYTVSNIDQSLPDGDLVLSTNLWTNGNVVITARNMIDVGTSGFRRVKLPSGSYSSTDPSNYTATTNGTYVFSIEDNAGNIRDKSIEVTNIDKVLPTFEVVSDNTDWTNEDINIRARNFADNASGVNEIEMPNGVRRVVSGSDELYGVSANGTYTFRLSDVAGNVFSRSIVVSNIDKLVPNAGTLALSSYAWSATGVEMIATPGSDNGPSGVSHLEYRIDGDAWKRMSSNRMVIPVGYAGELLVEVRTVDRAGNASVPVSRIAKIDGTPPEIHDIEVNVGERDVELIVDATDALSAIGGYRFLMKEIGTDADFRVMQDWSANPVFRRAGLVPNRLYEFRVQVRDLNLNTVTRDAVYMVTSPDVVSVETRENDYGNTVYGTWFTGLRAADGVVMEVSRSGNMVQRVNNGLQFVDRNLDYEREYQYSMKNVASVGGQVVESVPVVRSVTTGFPMLEMYLDRDTYHKTVFSDQVKVTGSLAYRQGGKTTVEVGGVSQTFDLDPLVRNKFSVLLMETRNSRVTLPMKAFLLGKEGLFDIERSIDVELKNVEIEGPGNDLLDTLYKR